MWHFVEDLLPFESFFVRVVLKKELIFMDGLLMFKFLCGWPFTARVKSACDESRISGRAELSAGQCVARQRLTGGFVILSAVEFDAGG
jgi:hypothetical protein